MSQVLEYDLQSCLPRCCRASDKSPSSSLNEHAVRMQSGRKTGPTEISKDQTKLLFISLTRLYSTRTRAKCMSHNSPSFVQQALLPLSHCLHMIILPFPLLLILPTVTHSATHTLRCLTGASRCYG